MKLIFPHKTDLEANIIIGFLTEEGIKYRTKLVREGIVNIYDIECNTSYEHFMFINKLTRDKLEPYLKAMKCFLLPSYEPEEHIVEEEQEEKTFDFSVFNPPLPPIIKFSPQYDYLKADILPPPHIVPIVGKINANADNNNKKKPKEKKQSILYKFLTWMIG